MTVEPAVTLPAPGSEAAAPDAGRVLRLLVVEDSEDDTLAMVRELSRAGLRVAFERVDNEADLLVALGQGGWDAVISDYRIPGFGGPEALDCVQQSGLEVPFIVVSGAIGEGPAVALMKAGAHDYVNKADLRRLVPALERELREVESRGWRSRAEERLVAGEHRFRALVQNASDVFAVVDSDGRIAYAGPSITRMLGYAPDEIVGTVAFAFVHPDDVERAAAALHDVVAVPELPASVTIRILHADGSWRHVEFIATNLVHEPAVAGIVVNMRDVTERVRTEEILREQGRVARFAAAVGAAFVARLPLDKALQRCTEAMVEHLHAALGRIWTLSDGDTHLELRASAGLDGQSDEEDARVRVGEVEIGLIAAEGKPHLTNDLPGDFGAPDQDGTRRDGMVAFAGYPLVLSGRVVGVTAMFAHRPISDAASQAMAAAADQIALGIDSRRMENELRVRARRQEALAHLGQEVPRVADVDKLLNVVVKRVAATLGADLVEVLELLPGGKKLLLRAGLGWDAGLAGRIAIPTDPATSAGYTVGADAAVVVTDFGSEGQLRASDLLARHGVVSGMTVAIAGRDTPWGILGVQSRHRREFTAADANFLTATASLLGGEILRRKAEDELLDRAIRDPLTQLPNRTLLMDRIEHALGRSKRLCGEAAVMFCDLDHFKAVNDRYGHKLGDELLIEVARRLALEVRPTDTVARFGGDEFVVLFEDVPTDAAALDLAGRVMAAFEAPFDVEGHRLFASASIGIARSGPGLSSAESLLRQADAAVYQAKEQGRGRAKIFDEELQRLAEERMAIDAALREALRHDELAVVYQPIVALDPDRVVGGEALVRWRCPERGVVSPADFIAVAEQSGLIATIDRWVLREACRQLEAWDVDEAIKLTTLAVNVSARHLQTGQLPALVTEALGATGTVPGRLALELTETVLMEDVERSLQSLHALKTLGVGLAVDDFGTGYSSLSQLKRLPVDTLKVDRSFIEGLGTPAGDTAIVAAMVAMAHSLGLRVLAEGVETGEQLAAVRALGCDLAQGHHFARPLPPADFARFVRSTGAQQDQETP